MYSLLASAVTHPDPIEPYQGLFNARSLEALNEKPIDLDVISPRPFAPPIGPYSAYADLPIVENCEPYPVHHPRFWYLLPKRLFYSLSGRSIANRIPDYLEQTFPVPDVVHACHIYLDGYGLLPYVQRHDLPLFVVAHGTLLNEFENHSTSVQSHIRETLGSATEVLCVSDALVERMQELKPGTPARTIPIGASPDRFPVSREPQLRAELGIDSESTVVLFVGGFTEAKGISDLATILPDLNGDATEFVFVGHEGNMESILRSAVRRSPFNPQHVYTGMSPIALRRWYAVADLLVLPSYSEGRPTVIYEAMASSTAVLATTVGGIPEQVVDGETGVLIPPGDPVTLASELNALVGDRVRLRRMGERGLARLRANRWTWADHAERVMERHRAALE